MPNPAKSAKTSVPGSNPGGASIFTEQNRSSTPWEGQRALSNWTTVDYRSSVRAVGRCGKSPVQNVLSRAWLSNGGGSQNLRRAAPKLDDGPAP
jgi:hypothetical protein